MAGVSEPEALAMVPWAQAALPKTAPAQIRVRRPDLRCLKARDRTAAACATAGQGGRYSAAHGIHDNTPRRLVLSAALRGRPPAPPVATFLPFFSPITCNQTVCESVLQLGEVSDSISLSLASLYMCWWLHRWWSGAQNTHSRGIFMALFLLLLPWDQPSRHISQGHHREA